MSDARALLSALHARIGTRDDPELDRILDQLRQLAGDPTAGDDTNALIHRLYDRLGGEPSHSHALCESCSFTGPVEDRPPVHSHAHVLCRDGTSSGEWQLDCTHENGSTFSVVGPSYNEALLRAIGTAELKARA